VTHTVTRSLPPKLVVSVLTVAAMFVSILDATIVNVTLPAVGTTFGVPATATDMVVAGYLVSAATVIPASGWLGDRFGERQVFLFALALFTTASALCALAWSLPMLVGFRVVQGLGGGMLTPVAMSMLFRCFGLAERIRAARVLVVPTALAPALGPVLGGLLVDVASWRWVFAVNLPIGVLAWMFGALFLVDRGKQAAGRFDVTGFLLTATGLALVTFSLGEAASRGWGSATVLACGVGGLVLIVILAAVELGGAEPMLDLRLFGDRMFRTVTLVSLTSTAAFLGVLYVFPLTYQRVLGASATATGLTAFSEAIGVMVGAQLAGRVYVAIGPRRQLALAVAAAAVAMVLFGLVDAATSPWVVRSILFGMGLAMGNVMHATQTAAFATLPMAKTGVASALFNCGRQVGAALGVAVLSGVLAGPAVAAGSPGVPTLDGYRLACVVAAGVMVVAAGLGLRVRDADAASTLPGVKPESYAAEPAVVDE